MHFKMMKSLLMASFLLFLTGNRMKTTTSYSNKDTLQHPSGKILLGHNSIMFLLLLMGGTK
jgi:hypothetical protein